jgi:hypothetical protein
MPRNLMMQKKYRANALVPREGERGGEVEGERERERGTLPLPLMLEIYFATVRIVSNLKREWKARERCSMSKQN